MLEIQSDEGGVKLKGIFDASQVAKADPVFSQLTTTTVVDCQDLEYIASAGLSVLLRTQKRLKEQGKELKLVHLNKHITEIFRYAGFDLIFDIQ